MNWVEGIAEAAGEDLDEICQEVARGESEALELWAGSFAVLRIEQAPAYREAVIVAGQGRNMKKALPLLEQRAKSKGADYIRAHVQRRGLVRMFQAQGYEIDHIIMRKKIDGQQK